MTDARIPDRWLIDRRFTRLPAGRFRAFVAALTWSASNHTDGVITPGDVPEIPWVRPGDMPAFVAAGLAARRNDGWVLVDFLSTQTSAEEWQKIEANRQKERERKARWRAGQGHVPRDRDGDGDADGDADQLRQGKDRQGQASNRTNNVSGEDDFAVVDNGYDRECADWFEAGSAYEPPAVDRDGFPLDDGGQR